MRDGIADYSLLQTLAQKNPAAAQELATRLILDFDPVQHGPRCVPQHPSGIAKASKPVELIQRLKAKC